MGDNYQEALRRIQEAAHTEATELDLAGLDLTELPSELWQLTQLTNLELQNNQLSSIPPEIGQLAQLKVLDLQNNQLSSIPPEIGQLTQLDALSLAMNQMSAIPPELWQLTRLNIFWLYDNQLSNIPPEIGQLTQLSILRLDNNPLTSPPPEIVELGTQAVLGYLAELALGSEQQWVSKVVVVGEGGVGKTTLLNRLRGENYNPDEDSTHGIAILPLECNHPDEQVTMNLNAWDFGGQVIYHATHQFFLTQRSLFVLVWNARLGFEQGRLYYWLDTIKARAPEAPVLLVATHIDERPADLPLAEIKQKYPQIVEQIEISSLTGDGIENLHTAIQREAASLPLMGEIWPTTWLSAANAIRANPEKHITQAELWEVMEENGVAEDSRGVLARWLHELGDVLYFPDDDELRDTVILKPQWVSEYISKVLTSDAVRERLGVFTRPHMDDLWVDIEPIMRERFLRLMENFDLSYPIPSDAQNRSLVVERLSFDEVAYQDQWGAIRGQQPCNEISMKFRLTSIMPAGIPNWFIARSHRFTTGTHWRYGALFADEDKRHLALVRAYPHDRYIELTVRGPYPHNFFALLKDGLELTLDRFPGLEVKRMIPCPGHDDEPCNYEFDNQNLERALEKQIIDVQCQVAFEDVSVTRLLFGLNFPITRDEIIRRLDEMKTANEEQHEALMNEMGELRALAQREFTNIYRREQALEESHCPYIFTLTPHKANFWKELLGHEVELQLYCQAPGHWHPPTKKGKYPIIDLNTIIGRYVVTLPNNWLQEMTPHLKRLVKVLKFAAPVAGAVANFGLPDDWLKNQIDLTSALINQMPDLKTDSAFSLVDDVGETLSHDRAEGPTLRALRKLLDEVDQNQHWGGLKKVLTPEGHYLWLCPHHAAKYRQKRQSRIGMR